MLFIIFHLFKYFLGCLDITCYHVLVAYTDENSANFPIKLGYQVQKIKYHFFQKFFSHLNFKIYEHEKFQSRSQIFPLKNLAHTPVMFTIRCINWEKRLIFAKYWHYEIKFTCRISTSQLNESRRIELWEETIWNMENTARRLFSRWYGSRNFQKVNLETLSNLPTEFQLFFLPSA